MNFLTVTVDVSGPIQQVTQTAADILPYVLTFCGMMAFYYLVKRWTDWDFSRIEARNAQEAREADARERADLAADLRKELAGQTLLFKGKAFYESTYGGNMSYDDYRAHWVLANHEMPEGHSQDCQCDWCAGAAGEIAWANQQLGNAPASGGGGGGGTDHSISCDCDACCRDWEEARRSMKL